MIAAPGHAPENVAGNSYDKYASTNRLERRMVAGFFDALDALIDTTIGDGGPPRSIVEVGAGDGRIVEHLAARLPDAAVVGLDLPDDGLAARWASRTRPMMFGDATRLPFDDASIDLIVGLEVLEHLRMPAAALAEIARVCRRHAVLSVPREPIWRVGNIARGRYLRELGNTPGHLHHWSARGFERFVDDVMEVSSTARPLPWTMVVAHPRRR